MAQIIMPLQVVRERTEQPRANALRIQPPANQRPQIHCHAPVIRCLHELARPVFKHSSSPTHCKRAARHTWRSRFAGASFRRRPAHGHHAFIACLVNMAGYADRSVSRGTSVAALAQPNPDVNAKRLLTLQLCGWLSLLLPWALTCALMIKGSGRGGA